MSIDGVRFGHVNVTALDWRRLADFYTVVFGCALDSQGHMYALDGGTGAILWTFPSGGS